MSFNAEHVNKREESVNKSLYIKRSLVERIDKIAKESGTSFNNVVISMIESCLKDESGPPV